MLGTVLTRIRMSLGAKIYTWEAIRIMVYDEQLLLSEYEVFALLTSLSTMLLIETRPC